MTRILLALFAITTTFRLNAQIETTINVPITTSASPTDQALLYLPSDYSTSGKSYPLLVFCHSASEAADGSSAGTGLAKIYNQASYGGPSYFIEHSGWPASFNNPITGAQEQFIVVSPQAKTWSLSGDQLANVINYLVATYRVDINRIHVTGVSAGGAGVAEYCAQLNSSESTPSLTADVRKWKPADMVPMSEASNDPTQSWANIVVADSIYFWGFGDINGDLYGGFTYDFYNFINKAKSGFARFTSFSTGHGPWNPFYNPTRTETFTWKNVNAGYSIYTWMLANSRGAAAPAANAGSPQTITLPNSQATLNGSGSTGTITSYGWAQLSGPSTADISSPTSVTTIVTGLVQGTYVFQLTINGKSNSTVQINVVPAPPAPVANAGAAQNITLPASQATLSGSNSTGTITSYSWTELSGPSTAVLTTPTAVSTKVSGLIAGVYIFQLTLNGGSTATVSVTVNSQTLVANAGNAQTINLPASQVTLSGSASTGTITSYLWTQVSGPSVGNNVSPTTVTTLVTGLVAGVYVFKLTLNGTNSATVQVTVVQPPPVANAGTSQTVFLPANQVTLDGTASSGNDISDLWTEVSGPSSAVFADDAAAVTVAGNLVQGVYIFMLTITDNQNMVATATVNVTVSNAATTKMINVNIYGGTNPYANTQWNNWNVNPSVNSPTLLYADGTSTGVMATLSINEGVVDNSATYGGVMAPAAVLRYSSFCETNRTLSFSGLKSNMTYNIELYASRNSNSGQKTIFQISGKTPDTISSYNNLTNKAVFNGIKSTAQGALTITISTPTGYSYLNGFAITEISGGTSTSGGSDAIVSGMETLETSTLDTALINTADIAFYPNPVQDQFTLAMNNRYTGTMKVTLVDASGVRRKSFEFVKTQQVSNTVIPMSDLPAGVYVVTVQIGNWHTVHKILKL